MKFTYLTKKQILCGIASAIAMAGISLSIAQAQNQEPLPEKIVDTVAGKTIDKFNNSSCQELAASMAKSPSQNPASETRQDKLKARFYTLLKENPELANRFFSQISTPVLTKLFQCGLIPPHE